MTRELLVHALFSPYEQQRDNVAFNLMTYDLWFIRKKNTDIYNRIGLEYFSPFKTIGLLILCYKKFSLTVKDYHLTKKINKLKKYWN